MALIKRRPKVTLFAPRVVRPGQSFEVEVGIEVTRALETSAIVVELEGEMLAGAGETQRSLRVIKLRAVTAVESTLEPGSHRHRVRFELPHGLPSSYKGLFVSISYQVAVRVEIPWWPDKRAYFPIRVVALAEPDERYDRARVLVPSIEGAASDDAHFEFSLGSQVIEPMGRINGALAVANVHAKRYSSFDLELIAIESYLEGRAQHRRTVRRWSIKSDERLGESGETMPFHLDLPRNLVAGFTAAPVSLSWMLQATLKVSWGRDRKLALPLKVRVRADGRRDVIGAQALAVGDERASAMWQQACDAEGWDFIEGGLATRRFGEDEVSVSRRDEGRNRGFVRIDFDHLGIDLRFEPGRRGGLVCDDEFVQGYLRARFAERLSELELIDAADDHIVFAAGGAALEEAEVRALLSIAAGTRAALQRIFDELPAAEAWPQRREELETLADALGGKAEPWACRVRGRYDGVPFWVRVRGPHWHFHAEVDPPFSTRESANLAEGRVDDDPVYGPWRERVSDFVRERGQLELRLADAGSVRGFPIDLATRLLDPLALRRDASLGGYR